MLLRGFTEMEELEIKYVSDMQTLEHKMDKIP